MVTPKPEKKDLHVSLQRSMRRAVLPFAILKTLKREPLHGYGIAKWLAGVLGGVIPEGTLYPMLNQFQTAGWIEAEWHVQGKGAARKRYHLTPEGETALEQLSASWAHIMDSLDHQNISSHQR